MLKIKPKSEITDDNKQNNAEVLREISKNLQLKPAALALNGQSANKATTGGTLKKKTYYYNYGTANPNQAVSGYSTSDLFHGSNSSSGADALDSATMQRSVSMGSGVSSQPSDRKSINLLGDLDLGSDTATTPSTTTTTTTGMRTSSTTPAIGSNATSLLDLDFSAAIPPPPSHPPPTSSSAGNLATLNPSLSVSMSLCKINENNSQLYNIDEDKEVESSFGHSQSSSSNLQNSYLNKRNSHNSPATTQASSSTNTSSNNNSSNNNGRFTPACFPGRTTPDFRHTTSLFEQQSIRASIVSPLTVIGSGSDIIPIAIAFNETIHAYFKMGGDTTKFKVKCFGCMKISFPFAILKHIQMELPPQLEFRLNNLQIANQDLKINSQLIQPVIKSTTTPGVQSPVVDPFGVALVAEPPLHFHFLTPNLVRELKEQHQQNKLAAFFNFELLKYEFKYNSTPLILNANWKCNESESTIELNVDYTHAFRKQLSQVNFMIVMPTQPAGAQKESAKISLTKSEPSALVQENENKLQILWQIATVNSNGHLMATFRIANKEEEAVKLSVSQLEQFYQPIYVKFHIDNETFSQVKFEILSPNYKLSLLKERIETGKYFCNYDHQQPQLQMTQQQPTTPTTTSNNESKSGEHVQKSSSLDQQQLDEHTNEADTPRTATTRSPTTTKTAILAAGSISTHIGSGVDVLLNY